MASIWRCPQLKSPTTVAHVPVEERRGGQRGGGEGTGQRGGGGVHVTQDMREEEIGTMYHAPWTEEVADSLMLYLA